MSDPADALARAVDLPGGLSIVVQGALLASNVAAIAHNCAAWRRIFPAAQIVCAISASDCLAELPPDGGVLRTLTPASHDSTVRAALAHIEAHCDVLALAAPALPLPPIKTDNPAPCNTNLMVAAAKAGLAQASGAWVLRIRGDLLLRDRSFLALYAADAGAPRGQWALFRERVLIPEVFTLNPLTLSHMPFHYSDWFNFGRREDVTAIWAATEGVSFADSIHYVSGEHRPGSNAVERRFNSRLAPEQAINFPVISQAFPSLRLAQHNDLSCVEESFGVLADNFVLANLRECRAYIPKYQRIVDAMSRYTRLECMNQVQVRRIIAQRDLPANTLFADLRRRADRIDSASGRPSWKQRLMLPRVQWRTR